MSARIYLIRNLVNGKGYVGFTVSTIEERWNQHCIESFSNNSSELLYRAMRKYGRFNFSIELITECEDEIFALKILEPKYIEEYDTFVRNERGYNLTKGGEGAIGLIHTLESKQKMRDAKLGVPLTEDHKESLRISAKRGKDHYNFNRDFSLEQRRKISENNTGRFDSLEAREKKSNARMGTLNPASCRFEVTLPNKTKVLVDDRAGFCRQHGLNYRTVKSYCLQSKWYRGYFFKRI